MIANLHGCVTAFAHILIILTNRYVKTFSKNKKNHKRITIKVIFISTF